MIVQLTWSLCFCFTFVLFNQICLKIHVYMNPICILKHKVMCLYSISYARGPVPLMYTRCNNILKVTIHDWQRTWLFMDSESWVHASYAWDISGPINTFSPTAHHSKSRHRRLTGHTMCEQIWKQFQFIKGFHTCKVLRMDPGFFRMCQKISQKCTHTWKGLFLQQNV